MKLNILKKLAFVCITAFIFSSQAQAAGKYTTFSFKNDTGSNVTISNVAWSGSYWPQFTTLTPADGVTLPAKHKTVLAYGYGYMSFKATITGGGRDGEYCNFSFDVSNSTHQLALVSKYGTASCNLEQTPTSTYTLTPYNDVKFLMQ